MSGLRDWLVQKIGGDADAPAQPDPNQPPANNAAAAAATAASPTAAAGESSPAPTEEQLRLMRLSRFGGAATATASAPAAEPRQEKRMKPSPAAVVSQQPAPPSSPSPSLPVSSAPVSAPASSSPARPSSAASPARAALGASPADLLTDPDEWASETLTLVFRATLQAGGGGGGKIVLSRLARELAEDKQRTDRLTMDHVDRILLEVVGTVPHASTAEYLYSCYSRVREQSEKVLNKRDPMRMQSLAAMSRSVLTFGVLFFSQPDVTFPHQPGKPERETHPSYGANQLVAFLDSENTDDLDRVRFAGDLVKSATDGQLLDILRPLLTVALRRRMTPRLLLLEEQSAMMAEYRGLLTLLNFPRVSAIAVTLPEWLPASVKTGRDLEKQSILGPFFTPSSYPDDPHVGDALLLNKTLRDEIFPVFDRLRHRFGVIQASLQQSLLACLKNKASRSAVTTWLVRAVNLNAARAFMRPDFERTSTHGFLLNLTAVCVALCEPVGAKLQTVDPNYCVFNVNGVDFSGTTRLAWDDKQVVARAQVLKDQYVPDQLTFNTEIFWITARVVSVGFRPAAAFYNSVFNALQEREGQLRELESIGHPQVASVRLAVSVTRKDKLSAEAHVKHPEMLSAICRFYDMVARWFTVTADPEKRGSWPTEPRPEIACVPQWLIDDLIFFYEWLAHHAVDILQLAAHHQNLLSFLALLLSSEKYLHSPHLRGRVVDLLTVLIPNKGNNLPPDMFEKNKFVTKLLIPGLIRFYIDCERTGGNNQFYDKFSIRFRISEIIEFLWNSDEIFRNAMISECSNQEQFLRFVTLLTNDATFLLDEAIHKLEEIHELEKLQENGAAWNALTPEQQEEKRESLGQLIRATRSYNLLANSSVKMFRNLSSYVVDPFMSPELVDRLASMLDYFLVQLAGPKCQNLKVNNPQAVGFDPKFLLRMLCTIYVNFGSRSEFVQALIRDERSYKQDVFVTTSQILRNRIAGVSEAEVVDFEAFVLRLESAAQEMVVDEPWGDDDIPEEFQDPIMSTLMRDPVTWEGSHITCDRAIITRQLLNEPIDPYTRRPLTAAQLVPVPELKKKIEAWMAEQRAKSKK